MSLTPIEIKKTRFGQKLRGYDAQEVDDFLSLVSDEMTARIADIERLQKECRYYQRRLEKTEEREHQLQQTLLRAQKVSDEITAAAHREAELLVKEAELTADRIVGQAVEQATELEKNIDDLRLRQRELYSRLKNDIDHFQRMIDDLNDQSSESQRASIHSLPRNRQGA